MRTTWPAPPRDAALHGVAGEFVTRTAPHTESDPMALLIQFPVSFGAAAGRDVHYPVEATRHHLNEYAILIGPSGKGRKGSAWDHVEALVSETDSGFAERCISSGLASGEGLIFEVRDPAPGDSGASDKRRLIIEPEFAQILKVLAREGNTLSPVVRRLTPNRARSEPRGARGERRRTEGGPGRDRYARVGRIARPSALAPCSVLRLPPDVGGERSTARAKRSQTRDAPPAPPPQPPLRCPRQFLASRRVNEPPPQIHRFRRTRLPRPVNGPQAHPRKHVNDSDHQQRRDVYTRG
jgi:hypothetical protein